MSTRESGSIRGAHRGRPLFLLGSGRCGSTRLYEIVREHPRIALTDEARIVDFLHFAAQLASVPVDEVRRLQLEEHVELRGVIRPQYTELFTRVFTDHAAELLVDFYTRWSDGLDCDYWGDKLPNPAAAAAARELLPETRLVAVVRDPRDYLCSVRRYTASPGIAEHHPYLQRTLEEHCAHWCNTYDGIARYLAGTYVLRYEDLVARPEATVSDVLAHLELEMHPACLEAIAACGSFERHGTSDSPEASVGRHASELSDEDRRRVEALCAELMAAHGYAAVD